MFDLIFNLSEKVFLNCYSLHYEEIVGRLKIRDRETHLGQAIRYLKEKNYYRKDDLIHSLKTEKINHAVQAAIIGISEDIGILANLGKAGAEKGWNSFLDVFLNLQNNQEIDVSKMLLLGEIDLKDIKEKS